MKKKVSSQNSKYKKKVSSQINIIKLTFEYLSPIFDTEDKMAL